jgi:hypothetical protein
LQPSPPFRLSHRASFHLNKKEYFEAPGINVMAFQDIYPDGNQGGVSIVQNGVRVAAARKELGQFDQNAWSRQIGEAIKAIKADEESLKLKNQFFGDAKHPLDTRQ